MNKQDREAQARLIRLGIDPDDAYQLHLIERRLHRWHELECGIGRGCIERDETTDKPYWVTQPTYNEAPYTNGNGRRILIRDREKSALKKLAAIMAQYPDLVPYVQSDPRGGALWILRRDKLNPEIGIDCQYTNGVAV